MDTSRWTKRSPLKFFVLVYALAIPFWLLGAFADKGLPLPMELPVGALMCVVPLTAALILVYREDRMRRRWEAAHGRRSSTRWKESPSGRVDEEVDPMAVQDLISALDRAGVSYERLAHHHVESASAEAAVLGLSLDEVAKTLVLKTPAGFIRTVIPASCRIDVRKVSDLLGESRKRIELATEDELARRYPEFELGAVPPFGGSDDGVIIDPQITHREWVVLEAGSHDESVRILTTDLLGLTRAQIADICED